MKRRRLYELIAVGFMLAGMIGFGGTVSAQAIEADGESAAPSFVIPPDSAIETAAQAPILSDAERKALVKRVHDLRERTAAKVDNGLPPLSLLPEGLMQPAGRETSLGDADTGVEVVNPSVFVIGRNNRNTRASTTGGSVLAEPAAVNNGVYVFGMGNTHSEYSTNGGVTWTNVTIPAGPADAPFPCCDPDVVIDDSRRVTFYSFLYTNSAGTNGVVRIFVRPNIPGANLCSYTIDPGGTANNVVPDYPHLGLSKNYLYLTINAIGGAGYARIYRFKLDSGMADCFSAATWTYTQPHSTAPGQRVWVPAEGTNGLEKMIWGQIDSSTTFRLFTWPESSTSPSFVTRTITASTFANPDCRGGTNNTDWLERPTSWTISGFRLRCAVAPEANSAGTTTAPGAVACYWNVANDASHPQAHVHSAVFSLQGYTLLAQPHIWNSTFCFGYPAVASNGRGDFGLSIAWGGRRGGGGPAVVGGVGIDDEFTPNIGFFGTVFATATGTHNPPGPDFRFGDYFTIRRHEPCGNWFVATNYALSGGTGVSNVNSRYVEFGRSLTQKCYNNFKNYFPQP